MEIHIDATSQSITTEKDGLTSIVEYTIHDGALDILHTRVPKALEGQGIASALVKAAYEYADTLGLQHAATCSYAKVWLKRKEGKE